MNLEEVGLDYALQYRYYMSYLLVTVLSFLKDAHTAHLFPDLEKSKLKKVRGGRQEEQEMRLAD